MPEWPLVDQPNCCRHPQTAWQRRINQTIWQHNHLRGHAQSRIKNKCTLILRWNTHYTHYTNMKRTWHILQKRTKHTTCTHCTH